MLLIPLHPPPNNAFSDPSLNAKDTPPNNLMCNLTHFQHVENPRVRETIKVNDGRTRFSFLSIMHVSLHCVSVARCDFPRMVLNCLIFLPYLTNKIWTIFGHKEQAGECFNVNKI